MTTSATKMVSATGNSNNNYNSNNNGSITSYNNSNNSRSSTSSISSKCNNSNNIKNVNNTNINSLITTTAATKTTEAAIDKSKNPPTSDDDVNNNRNNFKNVVIDKEEEDEEHGRKAVEDFSPLNMANLAMSIKAPILNKLHSYNNHGMITTSITTTTTRAMQSDEDFNIRFVNLVRNHKCLYDKKVPEYRNRDNQEKAWSLISQETRESVIHCKERWRNLRACLSRYIKQQSGADPQHKPYYLTEHMSFLLPFLKSTRNGNNCGLMGFPMENHQLHEYAHINHSHSQQKTINGDVNNLSALFQISAQQQQQQQQQQRHLMHLPAISVIPTTTTTTTTTITPETLQVKHSLSDNDDEETIDAFDTNIQQQQQQQQQQLYQNHNVQYQHCMSPTLSDTASANSMQQYIPDVQLSEAPSIQDAQQQQQQQQQHDYNNYHQQHHNHRRHHSHIMDAINGNTSPTLMTLHQTDAKRIKLENCDTAHNNNNNNNNANSSMCHHCDDNNFNHNADMEFFRSILPDIVNFSSQQKRKFKIGVLELIDDVFNRYPSTNTNNSNNNNNNRNIVAIDDRRK